MHEPVYRFCSLHASSSKLKRPGASLILGFRRRETITPSSVLWTSYLGMEIHSNYPGADRSLLAAVSIVSGFQDDEELIIADHVSQEEEEFAPT